MNMKGKHILALSKSLHSGQKGIVVEDWGNILLIKADDETYSGSYKDTVREGKYFQVDSLLVKQLK